MRTFLEVMGWILIVFSGISLTGAFMSCTIPVTGTSIMAIFYCLMGIVLGAMSIVVARIYEQMLKINKGV